MNIQSYYLFANYPLLTNADDSAIEAILNSNVANSQPDLAALSIVIAQFKNHFPDFYITIDLPTKKDLQNRLFLSITSKTAMPNAYADLQVKLGEVWQTIHISSIYGLRQEAISIFNHQEIADATNSIISCMLEEQEKYKASIKALAAIAAQLKTASIIPKSPIQSPFIQIYNYPSK